MMLNLLHCAKVQLWPNRNENDTKRFDDIPNRQDNYRTEFKNDDLNKSEKTTQHK